MEVGFPESTSYEQLKAIHAEAVASISTKEAEKTEETEEIHEEEDVEEISKQADEVDKTDEKEREDETKEEEGTPHVVTTEDLEANPELKDEGVKVGDTINLPVVDGEGNLEDSKEGEDEKEESEDEDGEEEEGFDEKKSKKLVGSKNKKGRSSNKK